MERFRKQKPRSFSTATTPVDAENWIAHIEKIFEVLGCADEFKARLASYKLEGDALNWWKAFKQAKEGETYIATLSWTNFHDIFFLRCFPRICEEFTTITLPLRLPAFAKSHGTYFSYQAC
ncbi:hypothetical protein Tco_0682382 [Tanacetum coccineum]|uniref:Zinc finger, CCHC-type, retrotransposon Gag domain protein n=1 Tax=Tanacetum coccineum TaxID=301880 RepID=A0ABQ4XQZ7_9ASTR